VRAAILARRPDDEASEVITAYNLCERLHCLPYAGGLYDQPARVVDLFIAVMSAHDEREAIDRNKNKPHGRR
jgi:hypothetical protein